MVRKSMQKIEYLFEICIWQNWLHLCYCGLDEKLNIGRMFFIENCCDKFATLCLTIHSLTQCAESRLWSDRDFEISGILVNLEVRESWIPKIAIPKFVILDQFFGNIFHRKLLQPVRDTLPLNLEIWKSWIPKKYGPKISHYLDQKHLTQKIF